MLKLALRKILQGILMLLAVSVITFTLLATAGGDALSALRDNPQVSEATIDELRQVYGLDRSFVERYGAWAASAVRGDFGESFSFKVPVASLVWSRFLNTLSMGLIALVIAILASAFLAVLAIRYRSHSLNAVIEAAIFLTASTPRMVLALVALVVSLRLGFPTVTAQGASWFSLTAGAIVLSVPLISILLAQLHQGLKEVMAEDFIRTARAKGLSEWAVITRHAIRPALNPFLTMAGLGLGALLGGSVIVETVLGWPGIGALMVSAVRGRDVPLVMGVVIVASLAVWLGNSLAEVLQAVNDKRLRANG